jgi:hypothetical protein
MHKKKRLILTLFFLGFFFCNPMIGQAKNIETLTLEASENIARGLNAKKFVRIAVTGIVESSGRQNGLTTFFQESIATRLNNSGFAIPERERLEQVAKENSLSLTRAFDDNTAVEFGRFLNADAVITGTLTKLATAYVLNTRAVDCASGMMVPNSGYQGRIKANKSIDDLFLQRTGLTLSVYFPSDMGGDVYVDGNLVNTVSSRNNVVTVSEISPGNHVVKVVVKNGLVKEQKVYIRKFENKIVHFRMFLPLKVRFWQEEKETKRIIGDKGRVYSGKRYRFCISANQDCHVYIFNLGTSNRFFPLVPNKKLKTSNFIEADKPKIIPGREENGFILKGSQGEEKIYVIASVTPIENLDAAAGKLVDKELLSQGFSRVIQAEKLKGFTKDYGFDENQPAVSESASLDPNNPVVMELTYSHR